MKVPPQIPSGIALILTTLATGLLIIACRNSVQPQTPPTLTLAPTHTTAPPGTTATVETRIPARRSGHRPYPPYLAFSLLRASKEPTSLQMPATLEAVLVGRKIVSVTLLAGRYEPGGERRLVSAMPIRRAAAGEAVNEEWRDGIHELTYVWETEGDYLSDGSEGDFVLLRELDPVENLWMVSGRYSSADSQQVEDAVLHINRESGEIAGVFNQQSGEIIQVSSGDEFQLLDYFLADSGASTSKSGEVLEFDQSGRLTYKRIPLPAGDYFLTYLATLASGSSTTLTVDYLVGNEKLLPGKRAYFQPEYGYQFLYPEEWSGLHTLSGPILSATVAPSMTLQIAIDPVRGEVGRGGGQQAILNSLGDVQVLYEDQFEMGLHGGLRTVYSYESSIGSRTGVLLTFSYDGRDFAIDVDGPTDDEQQIASLAQSLIDSWIWRSLPEATSENPWRTITIDDDKFVAPIGYRYDELLNGWKRLSDNQMNAFLAFRLDGEANASPDSRLLYWEKVARRDVSNYLRSDVYEQQLAGVSWQRIDFQYDNRDLGEIWGAIMSSNSDSGELIAWMEAPAGDFMRLEEQQLSLLLADLFMRQ